MKENLVILETIRQLETCNVHNSELRLQRSLYFIDFYTSNFKKESLQYYPYKCGAYSEKLADTLGELRAFGVIEAYCPDSTLAPQIRLTELGKKILHEESAKDDTFQLSKEKIKKCLQILEPLPYGELEAVSMAAILVRENLLKNEGDYQEHETTTIFNIVHKKSPTSKFSCLCSF